MFLTKNEMTEIIKILKYFTILPTLYLQYNNFTVSPVFIFWVQQPGEHGSSSSTLLKCLWTAFQRVFLIVLIPLSAWASTERIYFWKVTRGTSAVEAPATSLSWGGCCSTWFQRPAAAIALHVRLQLISCSRGCASGEHLKCPTLCLPLATASLTARCGRSPKLNCTCNAA